MDDEAVIESAARTLVYVRKCKDGDLATLPQSLRDAVNEIITLAGVPRVNVKAGKFESSLEMTGLLSFCDKQNRLMAKIRADSPAQPRRATASSLSVAGHAITIQSD
jgi:hypothetical protein